MVIDCLPIASEAPSAGEQCSRAISGGAGLVNISTFGFTSNPDAVGDKVEISYNVGGGIRFFGGRRAGFRTDIHRTHFSDNGVDVNFWEITAGMSIVLGGTY
jgi:hypothetical protein